MFCGVFPSRQILPSSYVHHRTWHSLLCLPPDSGGNESLSAISRHHWRVLLNGKSSSNMKIKFFMKQIVKPTSIKCPNLCRFTGICICRKDSFVHLYEGVCGGVVPSGRQTVPVPARWRHTAGCLPGVGGSIHSGQRDNSFEKCPPSMLNIAHIYLT